LKLIDLKKKVVDAVNAVSIAAGKHACLFRGVYGTEDRTTVRTAETHTTILLYYELKKVNLSFYKR
jgi:hypothetical protein